MIEVLPLSHCKDFNRLLQIGIPKFKNKHYIENSLLGIYYIDVDTNDRYYANIAHSDWYTENTFLSDTPLFSLEKKLLLKSGYACGVDINFLTSPLNLNLKFCDFIPTKFRRYVFNNDNISAIPLTKIFEICESIFEKIKSNFDFSLDKINSAEKIDSLFYESLYQTETNKITKIDGIEKTYYSDYNPYTITNRPTNSSGGINFTALSKKDNTRETIVAGNGSVFVQFDYTAFHPYLISKMLNINIPSNVDYYTYLNENFKFSTSTVREQIKADFFKMIYGYDKKQNDFSDKITQFETMLMDQYATKQSVTSFFLKRELFFKSGLNGNVLFNYFLQNMETEYNLLKLKQVLGSVQQDLASLVLYIYDSFIFKVPENNTEIIKKIESILINEGFPVKIYIGKNLQDLQLIN
jgi:hypothetical protein